MKDPDGTLECITPTDVPVQDYGKILVRNLHEPPKKGQEGQMVAGRVYKQNHVQHTWWEPLLWWVARVKWSETGMCNTTQHKDMCRITWLELLMLYQLQTGLRFPARDLDLASMERLFKVICTRGLKKC